MLCIISFIVSRFIYLGCLRLYFDESPLNYFVQYVDPQLLKTDLRKSLYYPYDQPPGFNLLLGIVLKAFPKNHALAFQLLFIGLGVLFALSLFALMVKFRGTSLDQHGLGNHLLVQPQCSIVRELALLHLSYCCLVVPCSRILASVCFQPRHMGWSGVFFILTLVAYIRGLFHFYWFIFFCLLLLYFFPQQRKKVVLAFCLPLLALVALYVKNYFVFGSLSTGDIFVAISLKEMSYYRMPEDKHRLLIEQRKLTRMSLIPAHSMDTNIENYTDIIGPLRRSGIAVLDQVRKSTGAVNLHHVGFLKLTKPMSQDNMYFIRERPDVYLEYVAQNYRWNYFLPATDHPVWFRDVKERRPVIEMLDRLFSLLFLGQRRPYGPAYFLVVGFPVLLAFGSYVGAKAYKTRNMATFITIVFVVANILYVTLVTTFFSYGEHNRYRFKVDGFYLVLLGLSISSGGAAIKALFHQREVIEKGRDHADAGFHASHDRATD